MALFSAPRKILANVRNTPTNPPPDTIVSTTQPNVAVKSNVARDIVIITSLGHFLCHLGETMYSAMLVVWMLEFRLTEFWSAVLPLLGIFLLGAGALPVSLIAHVRGPTRMFRLYFVLMCLSGILVALSPNVWMLFGSLTLLGIAVSIYHPIGLTLLSLGTREARGRAMGINGVAGNIGIALGPSLGALLSVLGMWRAAYVVFAVISLVSGIFFFRLTAQLKFTADDGSYMDPLLAVSPEKQNVVDKFGKANSSEKSWRSYVPLIMLLGVMVLGGLNYRSLITSLPVYLTGDAAVGKQKRTTHIISQTLGAQTSALTGGPMAATAQISVAAKVSQSEAFLPGKKTIASVLLFLSLIIGGFGQYFGGWLADKFGARYVYPGLILMLIPFSIALTFMEGQPYAFVFVSLLAVFLFGQQPVENSVLAEKTSAGFRSLSYGFKFILTFGIGSFGTMIVGIIWQNYDSVAPVYYFIAGSAVVMAILSAVALGIKIETQPVPESEKDPQPEMDEQILVEEKPITSDKS